MSNTRKTTTPAAKKAAAKRRAKPNPLAIIAAAKLPEATVELCLRGDLVAEFEELERQLRQPNEADARLVGDPNNRGIAERMEQIRDEMADSTIVFRLRALSRRRFLDFLAAHAPRDGDKLDASLGFNRETYFADLARACLIEPKLDDEQWEHLLDALTARQWEQLSGAASGLNQGEVTVPFSEAASAILSSSDEK